MSSGGLDPINNAQAWDVVYIAGQPSPGIAKVGEFKRAAEWDVKKGKGSLGATVTYVGRPPAKGSITFKLWTAAHFTAWDTFRPLFKYDPTKQAAQAVDIYHPSLADIDVLSVVCESIGNIVHEGDQLYSITIELLEYLPPPKVSAVSTPTTAQAGPPPPNTPPAVQDAQQQEIAALLQQASQP